MIGLHFHLTKIRVANGICLAGLAAMLLAVCVGPLNGSDDYPRSLVHFVAITPKYSYSIPWDPDKPEIQVPFKSSGGKSGTVYFIGHTKDYFGHEQYEIVGGDLMVRMDGADRTFAKTWKQRLVEVGILKMPGKDVQEIYFVSMEGDQFQSWHFNLFNPLTSTMVTLTYSWGHDDPASIEKTSDNYKDPTFSDERDILEGMARNPTYGIRFRTQI